MKYVGLQTQIAQNNRRSVLLLLAFPLIVLSLSWLFFYFMTSNEYDRYQQVDLANSISSTNLHLNSTNSNFINAAPIILIVVAIWFIIAYYANVYMINLATGARPLERNENKRVYNLVENLCISRGMTMPKINIIETDQLNAFASGLNPKSYTVTLTAGIIDHLNDDELEGVIAHELTHINNKDVRLLIISIVFVGIFSFLTSMLLRTLFFGRRRNNKEGNGVAILIALALAAVGYFITILLKFALSRKREYLADAGAVEMTHKPRALASALRKISGHSKIESKSGEVAQLYIDNHPSNGFFSFLGNLFSTHPPIEKRIEVLEQM